MISKLPMTSLSSDEWAALISASKYLETDTSFTKKNELVSAINKIKTEKGLPDGLNIIHSSPIKLNIDEELLKQIINDLEYAIEHKLFVKCHYISRSAKLDNQVKKGEYRPYALYIYQNMWYAIFERNNKPGKFFHVKLNRFKYLSITGKSFKEKYYESFKLDEYIEENGQVIDPLTFIIEINKKINPFFDEYKYGNQVVLTETDESISYQVTVQNKWQAKSIINHLGISCRVLSPTSLVDEIRTDLVNQLNKYKDVL
jgi:predicted DNA-binding transcriptional regulator YafY